MFLSAETFGSLRHPLLLLKTWPLLLVLSSGLSVFSFSPSLLPLYSHHPQSRPAAVRTQIRLSSTSSKTLSLKERLAELIPQEIENVRCYLLLPHIPAHLSLSTGQGHPCCPRQKGLRSCCRRPALWVCSTTTRSNHSLTHPAAV